MQSSNGFLVGLVPSEVVITTFRLTLPNVIISNLELSAWAPWGVDKTIVPLNGQQSNGYCSSC